MSGRKGAVIWACIIVLFTVLTLSAGIGVGVSAAAVDAEVVDAALEEETIVEGETATITATVENTGNETGTFTAELEEGGDIIDTRDVEVGPNETTTVEFVESFETAGTYDLAVNGVNAGTLDVTEPSSAEFDVVELTLSETEAVVGETVDVTAEVTNSGDADGAYSAELVIDGTVVDSQSIDVDANGTATVTFTRSFDAEGDYAIRVGDGPTQGLTVTQSQSAEFSVTDAELSETSVDPGQSVTITATVENTGNEAGTFTAELEEGGDVISTTDVDVAPGETTTVEFVESFETTGTYDLAVNGVNAGALDVTESSSAEFDVAELTLSETEVPAREPVTVTAEIANTGDAGGTYSAELVIDGTFVESQSVDIDAGETATVTFTRSFDAEGDYTIGVVDGPTQGLTVTQPQPAEFSVTSTDVSETDITPGETVTITATVENAGGTEGEFAADLRINGTTRDTETRVVDAGEQTTIDFATSFGETGTYGIAVNEDSVDTLTVLEPADVSVGETTIATDSAEVNEPVELAVELRNAGEATGQRTLDLALGDGTTVQRTTDVPENGTTLAITHAYTAPGEYTVTVDDATVGTVAVAGPQDGDSGSGGGSSGLFGSSGSSSSSGSATTENEEPTVVRSESDDAVTLNVDGATDGQYDLAVDLAGPSEGQSAVSVSLVGVDPAGDRESFETTVGRPTAEPEGRDPVPYGTALGYVEFGSTLDAANTSGATLRFAVDEEAIPDGLGPEDVGVLRYVDGEWTTADVTHDVDGDTHTVTLPEAAPVAVVALEPGRVDVVDGAVPADRVRISYETTVRVTVGNPGDRRATRNLTVSMNGEPLAEREVTLERRENTTVEIAFEPRESGPVSLEGDEVGTITVFEADDDAPSADAETDESVPGFGAIAAVLALLATAIGVRLRES